MKYKVIKLEDTKSVLVDESAGRSSKGFYIIVDKKSILCLAIDEHKGTHERNNQWAKIIVTINHSISLDVPMVFVDCEVENLAKEEFKIPENEIGNVYFGEKIAFLRVGFKKGYRAAQQKSYSDEDLRKAIDMARESCIIKTTAVPNGFIRFDNNEQQIIQSLKQEYIELEMESGYVGGSVGDDRIKTARVDGQLMAYLKK